MTGVPRDPWTRRWLRRAWTVPSFGLLALLWLATAPLLGPLAALADLVRKKRYATLRLWAFVGAYLWGEMAGVAMLTVAWLRSGFGLSRSRLHTLSYEVQSTWLRTLWRITVRIYSLELRVERPKSLPRGPFIVLMRHTSFVDTMIPGVFLAADYKINLRYVLKHELLISPSLDIGGHWLPTHFVREGGQDRRRELRSLRALAADMAPSDGVLIYPEGSRFSDIKRRQALRRLAERDRELHGLALRCHHTLPPRPGGTLALLNASPRASVLVVQHAGFLGFTSFRDMWEGALTGRKISIRIMLENREAIPNEAEARVRWLFDRWARVDAWVSSRETRYTESTLNSRITREPYDTVAPRRSHRPGDSRPNPQRSSDSHTRGRGPADSRPRDSRPRDS